MVASLASRHNHRAPTPQLQPPPESRGSNRRSRSSGCKRFSRRNQSAAAQYLRLENYPKKYPQPHCRNVANIPENTPVVSQKILRWVIFRDGEYPKPDPRIFPGTSIRVFSNDFGRNSLRSTPISENPHPQIFSRTAIRIFSGKRRAEPYPVLSEYKYSEALLPHLTTTTHHNIMTRQARP